MRFRVVVVLSAVAMLCLASVAVSQQRPGGRGQGFGGGFGGGTNRLSLLSIEAVQKELGLEPAQVEAIQKLREELRPMREGGKGRPQGGKGRPGGKAKAPEASNSVCGVIVNSVCIRLLSDETILARTVWNSGCPLCR